MQGNIDNEFQYSILQSSAADPSFYTSSLEHIYTNSDSWRKLKDTTKKGAGDTNITELRLQIQCSM